MRVAPASTRARSGASKRAAAAAAAVSVSSSRSAPASTRRTRSASSAAARRAPLSAAATRATSPASAASTASRSASSGQLASFALDLLTLGFVDVQHPDLTFASEPCSLELGRSGALVRARRLPARLVLEPSDPGQVGPELGCTLRARVGPCTQRLFEPRSNGNSNT